MATTKVAPKHVEANGSADSDVEIVNVTPALATTWLDLNVKNRAIRHGKVQQYAADMTSGDWRWTGESIKFDTVGNLIDGQHRLTAIVLSGVTLKILVVRGLESAAQEELDGGIPRQFHDALHLRGETNALILAAIIRRVALWEEGHRRTFAGSQAVSTPRLLHCFEAHPELREVAAKSRAIALNCELPASIVGTALWLFSKLDEEDTEFFFERLCDGQNMAQGDPIYELRRTLKGTVDVKGQRSQAYLMAITIKAWNAFRDGRSATERPVGMYRYKVGGAKPESFPEPV